MANKLKERRKLFKVFNRKGINLGWGNKTRKYQRISFWTWHFYVIYPKKKKRKINFYVFLKRLKGKREDYNTCMTNLLLSQSKNMLISQGTASNILSLTVEKLNWSREVKRSTSLNHRQPKRFVSKVCSLMITHPSGTSAIA